MKGVFIVANGLRVGDLDLGCPDASGRKGYVAFKLFALDTFYASILYFSIVNSKV
jgi:hypothetical protein